MYNIKDWCISRQLWWGHRIPAWYCPVCGEINVAQEDPKLCVQCGSADLAQDTDVLDTWFRSALWPFSSLGWPEKTRDIEKFYPTTLLITGFDIIFFWVARMIMQGLKFMGDVPFRTVYINSLVRDAEGQKMSKSKGNVIDPLEVMEQYGTDAVRFTLAIMAAPGTDIALSSEKMMSYRAFANKIWNACRFVLMSLESVGKDSIRIISPGEIARRQGELSTVDCWILSRLNGTIKEIDESLESYRFHEASHRIYHFFWHELCDWYVEFIKPFVLSEASDGKGRLTLEVLVHVFDQSLRLLHPFMPFITEELWQRLPHQGDSLAVEKYPDYHEGLTNLAAERKLELLTEVIIKIRNLRAELNIEASRRIRVNLGCPDDQTREWFQQSVSYIQNLARCEEVHVSPFLGPPAQDAARSVASGIEVEVPLAGLIDREEEQIRIQKEIAKIEREMAPIQQKLSNANFVANAPVQVVDLNRQRMSEFREKLAKFQAHLGMLKTSS
jgi:valyl-tRNA synthetase